MKLTITEAMDLVAKQAADGAPSPPPYSVVWLHAEYGRQQAHRARLGRLQMAAFAGVALTELLVLLVWNGSWIRENAVQHLSSIAASGIGALIAHTPVAMILALAMMTWALMEGLTSTE